MRLRKPGDTLRNHPIRATSTVEYKEMTPTHRIAVISGDGIGKEVMPEGIRAVESAAGRFGIDFRWEHFAWSCEEYLRTGKMMPEDGLDRLRDFDAIFLGAVGWPGVPDHLSLWGLLIPIRRAFDLYANVRPVRLLEGVRSPLADRAPGEIDFVVVRENTEGEYSRLGGRAFEGTERELVVQESVFTRKGVDRLLRYGFETAGERERRRLTSATKSNGIYHSMPFWDERFEALAEEYPDIETDRYHIDALTAALVRTPDRFDVLVASNLFGDILSDLGPALAGSLGMAPSANLNPEGRFPSMFEPVHGSAPDIAGQGVANPIGQVWAGAMMLEHLGHSEAASSIVQAIEAVLSEGGPRTPDLGGTASTREVGRALEDAARH